MVSIIKHQQQQRSAITTNNHHHLRCRRFLVFSERNRWLKATRNLRIPNLHSAVTFVFNFFLFCASVRWCWIWRIEEMIVEFLWTAKLRGISQCCCSSFSFPPLAIRHIRVVVAAPWIKQSENERNKLFSNKELEEFQNFLFSSSVDVGARVCLVYFALDRSKRTAKGTFFFCCVRVFKNKKAKAAKKKLDSELIEAGVCDLHETSFKNWFLSFVAVVAIDKRVEFKVS